MIPRPTGEITGEVTVDEIAEKCGVSVSAVRKWIRSPDWPAALPYRRSHKSLYPWGGVVRFVWARCGLPEPQGHVDDLLTVETVLGYLGGMPWRTWDWRVRAGKVPPGVVVDGVRRWRRGDVEVSQLETLLRRGVSARKPPKNG